MHDRTAMLRRGKVTSADGATIAYHSLGEGPGLVVVGGVLASGLDYLHLAQALSSDFEVHLMERRGRPHSDDQRPGHSITTECEDLCAVVAATNATAVFGHSFGGLIALEAARRRPLVDQIHVYEPGVPLRNGLGHEWLDEYKTLLERGDRRGAFASMVKCSGFAPRPLRVMPRWYVQLVLRAAVRGAKWSAMDQLLEANLTEHRIQRDLTAPSAERFSTIHARTLLLGGADSPSFISTKLLTELADVIPHSTVTVLPKLGHLAPIEAPQAICDAILVEHHRAAPQAPPPGPRT